MNLLMDTTHDLIAARDRERAWHAHVCLSDGQIDRPDRRADDWAPSIWLTAGAGGLTTREVTLIHATRVRDLRLADVAPLLGLSLPAARKARQRAEHKLRSWWATEGLAA